MQVQDASSLAVIADIHGNSDALAAVLDDIDRVGADMILNLGDHLSGPLAAAQTADMLSKRDITSILGNHDRFLIEHTPTEMGPSDRVAFDQLNEVHLDWLRTLAPTRVLGDEIFMCHGTPQSDLAYWLEKVLPDGSVVFNDRDVIEKAGVNLPYPLILCGHTHAARSVRLADGRLIVNPGSVGLPAYDDTHPRPHIMQSGSPDARYALLHRTDAQWRVSLKSVPYDSARMVMLAADAGRQDWANALSTGWLWPEGSSC